ncbi:gliding motility-associated C-terminal domain-containing protein [Pontibacter vulgaris]|uniref:gliding motility-associated C-terminal domain-containing protein n=1 Tax=Pontibacter vulgaris TaxID=2905679 RepID=UPI001FA6ADED|nr:gliding motility-associated C-terminal domain-containing protein [Pontibacter vulgaris]
MALWGKLSAVSKAAAFILYTFILSCLLPQKAEAQKHANIWYFGDRAGLDFNHGTPIIALTNSAMNAFEGTASIADNNGNLLFYSDGSTVWNKQHQVMTNGTGLLGHPSSSQSCIIVPNPEQKNIYYLFTTDSNGRPNGLKYSTIDIAKQNGLGEVTEKNIPLYTPTTEKMTAVLHANGRDIWVLTHEYGTNSIMAYLVASSGVATTPVVSKTGTIHTKETNGINAIGCMKASPNGKKLGISLGLGNWDSNKIELFDFNNATGVVSNPLILTTGNSPYGIEFSPDNSKLYVSIEAGLKLVQYDLTAGLIQDTRTVIGDLTPATTTRYTGAAIQLGPDGKLYIAKPQSQYLAVVQNPNAKGTDCGLLDNGVFLGGRVSQVGLPSFIQSFFNYSNDVQYTINCFGTASSFSFDASPFDVPTFMQWDFGDPASGAANIVNTLSAKHNFSAPGDYTVTFTRHISNKQETYTIGIKITAPPVVDLGPDRWVCPGTEVTLDATTLNATYKWSTGSTSASISTTTPGTYWVDVTVAECTTREEVRISNYTLPTVSLGADKELCEGETLELNTFNQGATYLWQDGSTNSTFTVTAPGTYRVEVTSQNGCKQTDEISIKYNPLPVINLGPDHNICANTTITLDATQPGMTYKWNTGATTPTITVAQAGEFRVTLTNSKGCTATDAIRVNHLPLPVVNLGRDTTLCTDETLLLNATFPNATYLWQDGSSAPTFKVMESGKYWVDVTNEFGCTVRDEIWVPYLVRPTIFLGNDTTLCYGDTLVIGKELPGSIKYKWQDGSTEAKYKVTKPGTYKLKAYNQHCEASDEITVKFKECIGGLFIPNIITPNGDGLNDVFFIHGLTEDDWELTLFNRWGNKVYHTGNYKNDWAPQPGTTTGMFYYMLEHRTTGRTYKGWLEVMQ